MKVDLFKINEYGLVANNMEELNVDLLLENTLSLHISNLDKYGRSPS